MLMTHCMCSLQPGTPRSALTAALAAMVVETSQSVNLGEDEGWPQADSVSASPFSALATSPFQSPNQCPWEAASPSATASPQDSAASPPFRDDYVSQMHITFDEAPNHPPPAAGATEASTIEGDDPDACASASAALLGALNGPSVAASARLAGCASPLAAASAALRQALSPGGQDSPSTGDTAGTSSTLAPAPAAAASRRLDEGDGVAHDRPPDSAVDRSLADTCAALAGGTSTRQQHVGPLVPAATSATAESAAPSGGSAAPPAPTVHAAAVGSHNILGFQATLSDKVGLIGAVHPAGTKASGESAPCSSLPGPGTPKVPATSTSIAAPTASQLSATSSSSGGASRPANAALSPAMPTQPASLRPHADSESQDVNDMHLTCKQVRNRPKFGIRLVVRRPSAGAAVSNFRFDCFVDGSYACDLISRSWFVNGRPGRFCICRGPPPLCTLSCTF